MTNLEFYYLDLWNKVKSEIQNDPSVDEQVFESYFKDSQLVFLDDKKAVIEVPIFIQKLVFDQKISFIQSLVQNLVQHPVEVIVQVEGSDSRPDVSYQSNSSRFHLDDNVMPDYLFSNFIVGNSNKEAHSAALASAYSPGKFYTPLFIYGNSGLGKTHLLNAVGNYIKKMSPEKSVYYTSGSNFVSSVVSAIKDGNIEQFKQQMNKLDVLLMDDIQFLAGKEKSHEIFFHIFNELVNNKKQIVLTSDRLPSEIKGLEDRLISRFSSGLSVGIDSPEFETALAILKLRLENQIVDPDMIDEDVLHYIATNFSKDVRKLEGALNRILFYSITFSQSDRIDLNVCLDAFKGNAASDRNELTPSKIKRIVADYYGLTRQQLVSNSRTKNISTARHIAMYFIRKYLDLPFAKIGEEFGKRDHTTVMNACEKVESNIKTNPDYKQAILELEKLFNRS